MYIVQCVAPIVINELFFLCTEADFLDEIQTKVWRVFLLAIQSDLYSVTYGLRNIQKPQVWELSKLYPETSKKFVSSWIWLLYTSSVLYLYLSTKILFNGYYHYILKYSTSGAWETGCGQWAMASVGWRPPRAAASQEWSPHWREWGGWSLASHSSFVTKRPFWRRWEAEGDGIVRRNNGGLYRLRNAGKSETMQCSQWRNSLLHSVGISTRMNSDGIITNYSLYSLHRGGISCIRNVGIATVTLLSRGPARQHTALAIKVKILYNVDENLCSMVERFDHRF